MFKFSVSRLLCLSGICFSALYFSASAQSSQASSVTPNGLAPTPPMGWNSWNHFGCNIDENIIKEMADAMVSSGMKDAGYEYINIDDCWMDTVRDAQGRLQADPKRFPHGIKWLADYVHSKGLKLGIYSSAGTKTCAGYPASLDHEEIDAKTFASWGVDYLKYDNCYNQGRPLIERYQAMQQALAHCGRPIVFSICEWGLENPWEWAPRLGNLWRTTGDIRDSWESVMSILDQQVGLASYAGPGHWNDPDMLEVGNGGMTTTEYRAHFSLWCILAAPLIAGNDLRHMSPETKEILTNRDMIAVDQDPLGKEGYKLQDDGDEEIWVKEMADGSRVVLFLNRGEHTAFMTTDAHQVGLPDAPQYRLRDLWSHKESHTESLIRGFVPSHGVLVFRVWPVKS
ncbi:glycoside hydrolase family 27 protein [Thermoflavifilum thermophilum]|uniref:Alpha-galactosidase n=1 Tax=Thermoflavifilum thermophilum TaxID=1393122 RepID=A0A1I7NCZ8_9BACT|nr:glycoside hydrolase family 27 protein [Thermoflavifilum thermophilum]SFV32433.1 alpha-galactosidase [Thermoflavifilum thermophilum]